MRLGGSAAVLVVAAWGSAGCVFQCVDTFAMGQGLTSNGNFGGATVLEAAPGGLWWIHGALDTARIEPFNEPQSARDVDVVVTTSTSTAIRVPVDLEVGTQWSLSAPGPDVDGLRVVSPADAAPSLDRDDLSVTFVEAATRPIVGSQMR